MKGHTKIELTDVISGEKNEVEHDNQVTSAIEKFLTPVPALGNISCRSYVTATTNVNFLEWFMGGIMLFDKIFDDNRDNYLPPDGAEMIAQGNNLSYSGINLKAGSFSRVESGLQEDGSYKLVWNFDTAHGNGKIASLGLCSIAGGTTGLGINAIDNVYQTSLLFGTYGLPKRMDGSAMNVDFLKNKFYMITKKDCASSNIFSNNAIRITGYNMALSSTELLKHFAREKSSDYAKDDSFDIPIPNNFFELAGIKNGSFYTCLSIHKKNAIIFCTPSYGTYVYSAFYGIKINFDTMESSIISVANLTGEKSAYGYSYEFRCGIYMYDDFMLFRGESTIIYIINTSDPTDIKKVQYNGADLKAKGLCVTCRIGNYVFVSDAVDNVGNATLVYIVDLTTGIAGIDMNRTFGFINSYTDISHVYAPIEELAGAIRVEESDASYNGSNKLRWEYIPFSLMTKNNLSEPVIKTASQTMKITYTLSPDAG